MNEWKELKIDNLPPDILTGDYEFEKREYNSEWKESMNNGSPLEVLICKSNYQDIDYRYRKPEPLPPTHEEIMTKWWKSEKGVNTWFKVFMYHANRYYCLGATVRDNTIPRFLILEGIDFLDRESADIPPETE